MPNAENEKNEKTKKQEKRIMRHELYDMLLKSIFHATCQGMNEKSGRKNGKKTKKEKEERMDKGNRGSHEKGNEKSGDHVRLHGGATGRLYKQGNVYQLEVRMPRIPYSIFKK